MEKYLYFAKNTTIDGHEDIALVPSSKIRGIVASTDNTSRTVNETQIKMNFADIDGTENDEAFIKLTHVYGDKKRVARSIVSLINGGRVKSPFIQACDLKNGVIAIDGVTALTITTTG